MLLYTNKLITDGRKQFAIRNSSIVIEKVKFLISWSEIIFLESFDDCLKSNRASTRG